MKTIVALFEDRSAAVQAMRGLLAHGIARERISLVASATVSDAKRSHLTLHEGDEAGSESATTSARSSVLDAATASASPAEGAGVSVGIGSVLLGVAFLSLPAVGPVLAAGPLLAGLAASGAGIGAVDLPLRLGESGMPASDADRYTRAVRRGGVLVVLVVSADDVDDVAMILADHAPVDPERLRDTTSPSR